jgi:hypothetical protein
VLATELVLKGRSDCQRQAQGDRAGFGMHLLVSQPARAGLENGSETGGEGGATGEREQRDQQRQAWRLEADLCQGATAGDELLNC